MKKIRFTKLLIFIVCLMILAQDALANFAWNNLSSGINETDVLKVFMTRSNNPKLYVATTKGLYRFEYDKQFKKIFSPPAQAKINDITVDDTNSGMIFTATDAGLYQGNENTNQWSRIFYSSDERTQTCLSVLKDGDTILVGTAEGLYFKSKNKTNWVPHEGLKNKAIYFIRENDNFYFIASSQTIYRVNKTEKSMTKIFSSGIGETKRSENDSSSENVALGANTIRALVLSRKFPQCVFVATSQGLFCSLNNGDDFLLVSTGSLSSNTITSMLVIDKKKEIKEHTVTSGNSNEMEKSKQNECRKEINKCFAFLIGTARGAFLSDNGTWISLYQGMQTNKINDLASDAQNTVYAATDQGIYSLTLNETLSGSVPSLNTSQSNNYPFTGFDYEAVMKKFSYEPTIQDVHRWAIDYAEVHPEKIKRWRRQASRKAWMPSLNIGLDQDKNKTTSDSVYGSYSGGGQQFIGADDKTFYDNFAWDVSLSWDLGDLIWNGDQTSIDSRAKLMVELREDILDQVTRLYFERRRIQIEMTVNGYSDPQMIWENQMRLAELTALLDAFTGGKFSRQIKHGCENRASNKTERRI